ncbi:unnamed protein product [Boreogadus saida]
MDPVQKAVLHHTLGVVPTVKRKHVSCSVCQLRFNSQGNCEVARFHCRVWNGSDRKGAGRVAFQPPKVGVTRTLPYPIRPHSGDCSVAVPKTEPDA